MRGAINCAADVCPPADMAQARDTPTLLNYFIGRWRQTRCINPGGAYIGEAEFLPVSAECLHYSEAGILTLDSGVAVRSSKSYLYEGTAGVIRVYFDEMPPRLFHTLRLDANDHAGPRATGSHHRCGSDHYNSTYEFETDDSFVIRHGAFGPAKDYVMVTRYQRLT